MIENSDKLLARGVSSLSDKELLMLLLEDMPHAEECVDRLLRRYNNSLRAIVEEDIPHLRMVEGIGLKRACRIAVSAEMVRRALRNPHESLRSISCSDDVVAHFTPIMSALTNEECWVLYLTASNSVVECQRVSSGGIVGTVVDHRLIIKRALELLAVQIIMVHNHPSGDATPSEEDMLLTQRVKAAAEVFDIRLLDHIIIGKTGVCSFRGAEIL